MIHKTQNMVSLFTVPHSRGGRICSQVISEFPFNAVLANLQFSNSSHSNFEFPLVNSHTSEILKKEAATFLLRVEKKLILKRFSFRHTLSRPF